MTIADHVPPSEMRSVTKSQPTRTPIDAMNGNRKRRRSSTTAASTSSSSASRATENPSNGWSPVATLSSQPHQAQSAPTKTAHATTEAYAKIPDAIQRPSRLNASAIAYSTTRMRSAQPANAARP